MRTQSKHMAIWQKDVALSLASIPPLVVIVCFPSSMGGLNAKSPMAEMRVLEGWVWDGPILIDPGDMVGSEFSLDLRSTVHQSDSHAPLGPVSGDSHQH